MPTPLQVTDFLQGRLSAPAASSSAGPAKLNGTVIVIGAGPAGLTAAHHLKVSPQEANRCQQHIACALCPHPRALLPLIPGFEHTLMATKTTQHCWPWLLYTNLSR